jgi:superfamily II DNA or RNA helicase
MSAVEQVARKSFELRGYQREALVSVFKAWQEFDRILGVAPTGSGKGLLLAAIIQVGQRIDPRPALILSHTDELLAQLVEKVIWVTGIKPSLEKAEVRADLNASIVVASIQTLSREHRLQDSREGRRQKPWRIAPANCVRDFSP